VYILTSVNVYKLYDVRFEVSRAIKIQAEGPLCTATVRSFASGCQRPRGLRCLQQFYTFVQVYLWPTPSSSLSLHPFTYLSVNGVEFSI
jgi:hypothetical protein